MTTPRNVTTAAAFTGAGTRGKACPPLAGAGDVAELGLGQGGAGDGAGGQPSPREWAIDGNSIRHKTRIMKTTLDLPDDIAQVLRLESARRGGRKAASLTALVSAAVRKTYGTPAAKKPRIDLTPGRVVISAATDAPKLTPALINGALYD